MSLAKNVPKDLSSLLQAMTTDLPEVLRGNLVGVYLWGSLTYDAFDEMCSDVDCVAVSAVPKDRRRSRCGRLIMSLGKADERDIRGIGHAELKMALDEFRQSLTATEPPAGLTHALAGLWWDAKGDWARAHESAQQDEGVEGSWVHAYLHRKEGDQSNAAYWYRRAGKPVCREPLDAEWGSIVEALLIQISKATL